MSATWRNTRQLLIAWPLLRVGAPGGGAVADDDGIHHAMLPPLGTMNGYGSALSSTRLPQQVVMVARAFHLLVLTAKVAFVE